MTEPNPHAAYLRRLGHADAADALEAVAALTPTPPTAQAEQAQSAPKSPRDQEAEALLEAMRRDLAPGGWSSVPASDGEAP